MKTFETPGDFKRCMRQESVAKKKSKYQNSGN